MAAVLVFAALPTRGALEATVGDRQSTVTLVAHFAEFIVLGMLVLAAARRDRGAREALTRAVAVGVAVALGTELLQAALPWRSFEVRDLVLDLLGLAVGLALVSRRGAGARAARGRRG
ncbi:MAG: VanZ family protein [Thermoleophilia bacterium]|nr:VanZ family protein [Thermoleophilia bacterium]